MPGAPSSAYTLMPESSARAGRLAPRAAASAAASVTRTQTQTVQQAFQLSGLLFGQQDGIEIRGGHVIHNGSSQFRKFITLFRRALVKPTPQAFNKCMLIHSAEMSTRPSSALVALHFA